jgi:type I restriction enzyme S subunit
MREIRSYSLPDHWVWTKLGEVLKLKSGDPLTQKEMVEGPFPVYGGNGVTGYHHKGNIASETIIVGRVGFYCGSVHLSPKDAWVTDNAFTVTFDDHTLNQTYLYWLLKTLNLRKYSNSSAQPVISGKTVYPIEFPLPPLDEQKRIADKVERLLGKIRQAKQRVEEAQETFGLRRAAILDQAFRGELLGDHTAAKERYKLTRTMTLDIPTHWHLRSIKEVTDNFNNARIPITKHNREHGETPYYGATGVVDYVSGYTHDGTYILIGEDGANLLSRSKPQAYQVRGQVWVNNHAHVLKMKDDMCDRYFMHYLNFLPLNDFVTGTAQPKLNRSNLDKIQIPIPPVEEQLAIASRIDMLFAKEELIVQHAADTLDLLGLTENSILTKAFRGELGRVV